MPSRNLFLCAVWLLTCLLSPTAFAHKPSDSYLRIDASDADLSGEWDIALKDLELVVGLDANGDGKITWGELKASEEVVTGHALPRLAILADGEPCTLTETGLMVSRHSDGAYATLSIRDRLSLGRRRDHP